MFVHLLDGLPRVRGGARGGVEERSGRVDAGHAVESGDRHVAKRRPSHPQH